MPWTHDTSLPLYVLLSVLGCALTAAIWHDVRTYRVPNAIVVTGTLSAFTLHTLLHALKPSTGLGLTGAVLGFAVGFALFLPFYLMRAAGAGDVKLMAMVGAFLGPLDMVAAYIWTCVAGALLAVVYASRKRVLGKMASNILRILQSMLPSSHATQPIAFHSHQSAAKVPYSVAIAAGSLVWVTLRLTH